MRKILVLFGAPVSVLALLLFGYSFLYAEVPGLFLGIAVLGGAAVYFGVRRVFPAMWLYAAGLLFFMVAYPKLEGLESYSREGVLRGRVSLLRQQLLERRGAIGKWPEDASGLSAEGFDLRAGHKTGPAVELFVFSRETYLWPPERLGEKLVVTALEAGAPEEELISRLWGGNSREPLFLYPGKEYTYEVRRERDGTLISSGTVGSPVPRGFVVDSGAVVYDPSTGALFINCVHRRKQRPVEQWWQI